MFVLSYVKIVDYVLAWNWFMCEQNLKYIMFGIYSQVLGFQIIFGDLTF
jgi:hypothetical protein